ncbi:uncharacterized protein RJT20DRAFT_97512 [Scheffersomyces xylosifermentans]|uniref:uncharacterized protein n=1 Tax=Scheffersomyces xylosifermentans TaxID=1304137 RepID=UPI00315D3C3C
MMFQNDSKFPSAPPNSSNPTIMDSPFNQTQQLLHPAGFASNSMNNHTINQNISDVNSDINTTNNTTGTQSIFRTSYSPEPPSSSGVDSSITNLFSNAPNTSSSSISKPAVVTNKHVNPSAVQSSNKKRKSNVRACDACAIRKVKCEARRPCNHCVANNLNCTQLRERKKSGPKNLHRKTLDSINSLSEVIEINNGKPVMKKRPSLSATPSANNVIPIKESSNEAEDDQLSSSASSVAVSSAQATNMNPTSSKGFENNTAAEYKVTPYNLIENIALIGDEPIVFELVKPLTVQSLVINYMKLIEFITTNFPNYHHLPNNPLHSEINLMEHHDDMIFLSKLLIVLTVNLIICEILIKLKKQKFRNFIKYPKKNLLFRNFKNYKNLLHFKCIEVNTLIEKNFIVPPIIPQNNAKNLNNLNLNHINQYQIYYNLSLSSLHLCNYYHTLNLTNTLNTTTSNDNNYGNEAQEHQKLVNLRKSIAYYQLINIKSNDSAIVVQLYELFEMLFTFERYYMVYSSNNYNLNLVRNTDIIVHLNSRRFLKYKSDNINNSFNSNFLFELISIIDDANDVDSNILGKLVRFSNFNVSLKYADSDASRYPSLRDKIRALNSGDEVLEVIKNVLIFKLLVTFPLSLEDSKRELIQITKDFNASLSKSDTDLFKLQISNYQLLPHMLHLLKILLEINDDEAKIKMEHDLTQARRIENAQEDQIIVEFSDNLIKHFPFFNNINKLIRSEKLLNSWFLNLAENRQKLKEFKKMNDHKQLLERELIKSQDTNIDVSINHLLEELDATKLMITSTNSSVPNSTLVTNYPSPEVAIKQLPKAHRMVPDDEEDEDEDEEGYFSINPGRPASIPNAVAARSTQMASRASSAASTSSSHSVTSATSVEHGTNLPPVSSTTTMKNENVGMNSSGSNNMAMSASTKNLYNLFTQINEDFYGGGTSGSLTNLLQFNSTYLGGVAASPTANHGGITGMTPMNHSMNTPSVHSHSNPNISNSLGHSNKEEDIKLTPGQFLM